MFDNDFFRDNPSIMFIIPHFAILLVSVLSGLMKGFLHNVVAVLGMSS